MTVMDRLKLQQNRGYAIAGGAAIIAFIAYFLPYVSWSYSVLGTNYGGSVSGANSLGWLWLEFLAVLVSIAVAAVLIFRNNVLTGMVNMPVEKQTLYARYALIGAGALALLIHLIFLLDYSSAGGIVSGPGYSFGLGFGWFLFLLAAIGMVVGAVMAIRQPIPAYTGTASQPYGQYSQPYPGQTQYPPYQQPYSTTDQPQYPPYQSPPQQYPAQQYPAQPQQPYQQPQQYPPSQPQQYPPTELQQPPQQYPPQR